MHHHCTPRFLPNRVIFPLMSIWSNGANSVARQLVFANILLQNMLPIFYESKISQAVEFRVKFIFGVKCFDVQNIENKNKNETHDVSN